LQLCSISTLATKYEVRSTPKIEIIKLEEKKEGYNRTISILIEKLGENG